MLFQKQGNIYSNGLFQIFIDKQIGRGAYGVVYECKNVNLGDELCAKIILSKSDNADYLKRESDIINLLSQAYPNNQNLIKVYFCNYQKIDGNDVLIVIMERCKTNLKDELAKKYQYNSNEVLNIFKQLLNGYKPLYEKSILHRDIKPENILISYDNNNNPIYKLADFGIGKIYENNDVGITKVGTPVYAAPELNSFVNDKNLDEALKELKVIKNGKSQVDVFSFGIMLYQCIFGKPPFETRNQQQVEEFFKKLKTEKFKILESTINMNMEFLKMIEKMIVYNPLERIKFTDIFQHQLISIQILEPRRFEQIGRNNHMRHTLNPTPTQPQTPNPTQNPTPNPTFNPTPNPTFNPTPNPTQNPTPNPTFNPNPTPINHNPSFIPIAQPQNTFQPINQFPSPAPQQFRQTIGVAQQPRMGSYNPPDNNKPIPGDTVQFSSTGSSSYQSSLSQNYIIIDQLNDPLNYLSTQISENSYFYCQQTISLLRNAQQSLQNKNENQILSSLGKLGECYKYLDFQTYSLGFLKFYYCLISKKNNQPIKQQFNNEQELKQAIVEILKKYPN